jgi:hypothetical protein
MSPDRNNHEIPSDFRQLTGQFHNQSRSACSAITPISPQNVQSLRRPAALCARRLRSCDESRRAELVVTRGAFRDGAAYRYQGPRIRGHRRLCGRERIRPYRRRFRRASVIAERLEAPRPSRIANPQCIHPRTVPDPFGHVSNPRGPRRDRVFFITELCRLYNCRAEQSSTGSDEIKSRWRLQSHHPHFSDQVEKRHIRP